MPTLNSIQYYDFSTMEHGDTQQTYKNIVPRSTEKNTFNLNEDIRGGVAHGTKMGKET